MAEVNDCYLVLETVHDERKRVMDQRAARDDALVQRGNWVGLKRAMQASKVINIPNRVELMPQNVPTKGGNSTRHFDA